MDPSKSPLSAKLQAFPVKTNGFRAMVTLSEANKRLRFLKNYSTSAILQRIQNVLWCFKSALFRCLTAGNCVKRVNGALLWGVQSSSHQADFHFIITCPSFFLSSISASLKELTCVFFFLPSLLCSSPPSLSFAFGLFMSLLSLPPACASCWPPDELYAQKLKYKAISEELDHALNDMTSL